MGDLLAILEMQNKPVLIAIDEFQQILEYPETQSDAWLRSLVQQLRHVHLLFAGSQQQLMQDLFSNPSRPFYRSNQFLRLESCPMTGTGSSSIIPFETTVDSLNWKLWRKF